MYYHVKIGTDFKLNEEHTSWTIKKIIFQINKYYQMVFTENLFNDTVSILKSDHLQSVEKVAMYKVLTYGLLHRARGYRAKKDTMYKGINLRAFTPRQRLPC